MELHRISSKLLHSRNWKMSRHHFCDLTLLFLLWLWLHCSIPTNADDLPTCQSKDFHYDFTNCDEQGGRWRVSVPMPGICTGGAPNAPIRVYDCNTTCDPGDYFNVTILKCQKCPSGTYSLGGGIIFDSWKSLPYGFHVIADNFQSSFRALFPPVRGDRTQQVDCSKFGWQPLGDVIASEVSPCTSILVFTTKLVKPGKLSYTYQYVEDSVVFQFQAQNEQCQAVEETEQNKWPPITEQGKWRTLNVPLKAGLNILKWRTIGVNSDGNRHSKSVLIKNIEISGLAFTSACVPCKNGTFSGERALECEPCALNTYSNQGAQACTQCEQDQYSGKGSAKCIPKLPCTENDYYPLHTPCDSHKQTQITYKWIEPKICNEVVPGAASLPYLSPKKSNCPPCNPGMHYTNTSGCSFCPPNEFSDGVHGCRPCPTSAAPNYGYQFLWWNELPPGMEASCMSVSDGCRTSQGWRVAQDHIHSGRGHTGDAYVALSLRVPGFRTEDGIVNGRPIEVGRLSFVFQLLCEIECELLFIQESNTRGTSIIQSWNNTIAKGKQHYTYVVTKNDTYLFSWVFWKHDNRDPSISFDIERDESLDTDDDRAKIFTINVTNTINGGASECLLCSRDFEKDGCIPCPPGQFVDGNSTICKTCPPNTFVSEPFPYGIESCKKCGPGLQSDDGHACYSDCVIRDVNGHQYDLRKLSGFHQVQGSRLFTSSGTEYYHQFNVSLCGKKDLANTICINNITSRGVGKGMEVLHSIVCRSTMIPIKENEGLGNFAAQSISLGDHLIGITTEPSLSNISVIKEFYQKRARYPDLHFFYSSPTTTKACPGGRKTTITLRCDPVAGGTGNITLPPSCPDGTCDGCSFHFMWLSKWACPTCTQDDYEIVAGECSHGVQTIHYIAPKHCLLPQGLEKLENKKRACSAIPEEVQIVIGFAALLGALLFILVIYFWKKNRKLEYNYMKLVQSANSKDGELPPAESCALHDDEEDHFDSVEFRESKGKMLLSKLRSMAGNKDDKRQPFESLHLTEKDDHT